MINNYVDHEKDSSAKLVRVQTQKLEILARSGERLSNIRNPQRRSRCARPHGSPDSCQGRRIAAALCRVGMMLRRWVVYYVRTDGVARLSHWRMRDVIRPWRLMHAADSH